MAEQLIVDYRQAELDATDRVLCDYAIKLTLAPAEMDASDVQRLRSRGLVDEQITVATQVISYFNYINRIADGLGVDEEKWMRRHSRDEWERRRGRGYLESIRG